MFGYVGANYGELTAAEKERYGSVYCGVCLRIREQSGSLGRLGLSYDMAFLALLLMSLYEPRENRGPNACILHPVKRRPWVDSDCIRYAADMNVALSYYKFLDDWKDDHNAAAWAMARMLEDSFRDIEVCWPRQCRAIRSCIRELSRLEGENCPNPDLPAGIFGDLMAELLVFQEDLWSPTLRSLGQSLGRFIYLMDAAVDYSRDLKKGKYNPYIAMGLGEDRQRWEEYLVGIMGRCTQAYEKLPLVQDKSLLDNILYSGVWVNYRSRREKRKERDPK